MTRMTKALSAEATTKTNPTGNPYCGALRRRLRSRRVRFLRGIPRTVALAATPTSLTAKTFILAMMVAKAIGEALLSACISIDDWKDQGAGKYRKFPPFDLGWEHMLRLGALGRGCCRRPHPRVHRDWCIGNRYSVTDGA